MKTTLKTVCLAAFLIGSSTIVGCKKDDAPTENPTNPTAITYTITFNTDGGTAVAPLTVESGKTATKPTDPTKANFSFVGWYKDLLLTTAFDFATEKITANTTLYAKWATNTFAVTFNSNGGSVVAPINAENGKTISKPTDPTKAGFVFDGWYNEETLATPFDFTLQTISKATTLYAKWKADMVTVTFYLNDGMGTVENKETSKNSKLSSMPTPTKYNSVFLDWYTDTSFTTKFDSSQPISTNTKVYARWITFETETTGLANDEIRIIKFNSLILFEEIVVPSTLNGKKVVEIMGSNLINKKITKVTLPEGIKKIGDYAFSGCEVLTAINIPNSVTEIGQASFWFCKKLTDIPIPNSVTSIGQYALRNTGITTFTVPNSVTSIGGSAFYECSNLISINIPSSVTSIGGLCFGLCPQLQEVIINATTPPTSTGTLFFEGTPSNLQIKVPSGSVETYKNALKWNVYADKFFSL